MLFFLQVNTALKYWIIMQQSNKLTESRGFAARQPGEQFVDPTNRSDVATFQGLTLLPPNDISYANPEELQSAFDAWKTTVEDTGTTYLLNRPGALRAALIVTMDTPRGIERFVLFTKDNRVLEGKLTSIPPNVIPGHGGYVMDRSRSFDERAGLKPSDVISGSRKFKPRDVVELLDAARSSAGDEPVDQMQAYLTALINNKGENYRIKGGAKYSGLHNKYLGEWAAPIALMTTQIEPANQVSELETSMFGDHSLDLALIRYNTSVSAALVDSALIYGAYEISISSKSHKGGGAAASLKGLQDTVEEKSHEFDAEFWSTPKNQKFKRVLENITKKSAIDGVLDLSVEEQIIPASDIARIKDLIDDTQAALPSSGTTELLKSYAANEAHPRYNLGLHYLAAVARAVVRKLNDEDYTDPVKNILNHSNIVQMNFVTSISGEDLICKTFKLIWPPVFEGKILFFADKAFSATEVKGRLGFKIKTGAEPPAPDESLKAPGLSAVDRERRKQARAQSVGKIISPGERDARDEDVPDEIALGRASKRLD